MHVSLQYFFQFVLPLQKIVILLHTTINIRTNHERIIRNFKLLLLLLLCMDVQGGKLRVEFNSYFESEEI